jgi:sporadic carbohydrate cluster protein (TIGR04323 family)|tara:strand:- start:309 stop:707 length:399 start_codon:yes stop_codon:yes gene_type:complete
MKGYRGYIFSRNINGNFIPQRVQNLVIRDFAFRKKIFFKLSSTEYNMKNCYTMLNTLIKDINKIDGIIFYSIEMLPDNKNEALKLISLFLKKNKMLYFAVEELKVSSKSDLKKIEDILSIKKNYMRLKNLKL